MLDELELPGDLSGEELTERLLAFLGKYYHFTAGEGIAGGAPAASAPLLPQNHRPQATRPPLRPRLQRAHRDRPRRRGLCRDPAPPERPEPCAVGGDDPQSLWRITSASRCSTPARRRSSSTSSAPTRTSSATCTSPAARTPGIRASAASPTPGARRRLRGCSSTATPYAADAERKP